MSWQHGDLLWLLLAVPLLAGLPVFAWWPRLVCSPPRRFGRLGGMMIHHHHVLRAHGNLFCGFADGAAESLAQEAHHHLELFAWRKSTLLGGINQAALVVSICIVVVFRETTSVAANKL